jgi:GH25 family lysozyme M1 (1,4-beta-N-acetylmuramidase)
MKDFRHNRKKIILVILLVVAVLITAYFIVIRDNNNQGDKPRPTNTINYDGPTEEEKKAGDIQKEADKQRQEINNSAPPQTANIVIVDSSQYDSTIEIRSYVSNVYEDGGTCKATLTNGSKTVSKTSTAFKDATTTQCEPIDIPRSEFTSTGDWKLVLSYSSSKIQGETNGSVRIK